MARDFMIMDSSNIEWIFLEQKQNSSNNNGIISYRHVICQALHSIKDGDDIEKKFKDFKIAFDKDENYTENSFLELYFFESDKDKKVALIIDRTKGIYPLILDQHNKRYQAFSHSLKNIENKYSEIMDLLRKYDKWSQKLQENLEKYYNTSNKSNN